MTLNEVSAYIASEGYTLLSEEYRDSRTKLEIRCPSNHVFNVTWDNFKRKGTRCAVCSGKAKYSYEFVRETVNSAGYKLHSSSYKNVFSKIDVECPEGHRYKTTFSIFNYGHRCMTCAVEERAKARRLDPVDAHDFIESFGYQVKSKYFNARSKMAIECPKGHSFEMIYNNFQQGTRCPRCYTSKGENLIRNILALSLPRASQFSEQYHATIRGHHRYYDFYVEHAGRRILIEYDGAQHFISVDLFGGDEALAHNQRVDAMKNEWAVENGFELWRFNYTQSPEEVHTALISRLGIARVEMDYTTALLNVI